MNPMTNVKNITKLCEEELKGRNKMSWHEQYRGSAWIFVGGLPYDLTEGDILCVFSQYGEPINVNLIRDKDTGKSKGFCFICYEDQRSTDLAVDNLNGIKLLGRTLRVDHVEKYKPPKNIKDEKFETASEIKKEKHQKDKENRGDYSPIFEKEDEMDNEISKNQNKRAEKYNHDNYYNSDDSNVNSSSNVNSRKEKEVKIKKKRKRQDSDREIKPKDKIEARRKKKSKRKLDSSSSSLSSSTSSLSSLSSCSESKKHRKSKTERYDIQKRNKTIRDLRREAELIQAELKRRQQAEERMRKSHRDVNGRQESKKEGRRKEYKCGSSKEREDDVERMRERSESRRRERKDPSSCSRNGHHSKTIDTVTENSRRHKYQ